MLDAFADEGGNLLYTADHYAAGRSEVMLGSWLRNRRDRSGFVVATTIGRHPDARGLSPRAVARATEASLQRLDTECIDILVLDGEDTSVPIDDTLEAVDMLLRAGKVAHLAVIGHAAARIRAMQERSAEARYPRIAGVFQEYSLMTRSVLERELAPLAAEGDLGLFARRPLAHGFLTGEVSKQGSESPIWGRALEHTGRRGQRVLDRLRQVAEEQGVSLARTAAAWAISKPGVTAALVAARSAEEMIDVYRARELVLTRQQVALLDDVSSPAPAAA